MQAWRPGSLGEPRKARCSPTGMITNGRRAVDFVPMLPLVLFAPGAGAPSSSPWMRAWAGRLGAFGRVVSMDYPYALEGRGRPDPLPRLIAAHRAALAAARTDGAVVLAGKSMGGRVGCHVALEERTLALVCLGYPLRGVTGKRRDQVLLALRTPVLFVQGARDALCPLADLGG